MNNEMQIGTRVRRTINDKAEGLILGIGGNNIVVEGLWYVVGWDDGQTTQVHESTLEVVEEKEEEELPRVFVGIQYKDGSYHAERFITTWPRAVTFAERMARWGSVEEVSVSHRSADGGTSHLTITGSNS